MIPLILQVLKDFRVIATVIAMILIVKFAKFIATYRKKPPKSLKSKPKTVKKAPAKAPESQEASDTQENSAE